MPTCIFLRDSLSKTISLAADSTCKQNCEAQMLSVQIFNSDEAAACTDGAKVLLKCVMMLLISDKIDKGNVYVRNIPR